MELNRLCNYHHRHSHIHTAFLFVVHGFLFAQLHFNDRFISATTTSADTTPIHSLNLTLSSLCEWIQESAIHASSFQRPSPNEERLCTALHCNWWLVFVLRSAHGFKTSHKFSTIIWWQRIASGRSFVLFAKLHSRILPIRLHLHSAVTKRVAFHCNLSRNYVVQISLCHWKLTTIIIYVTLCSFVWSEPYARFVHRRLLLV